MNSKLFAKNSINLFEILIIYNTHFTNPINQNIENGMPTYRMMILIIILLSLILFFINIIVLWLIYNLKSQLIIE